MALVALFAGTAILSVAFICGFLKHQPLGIDPPGGLGALETSLAVRPEYPVSTFLYDRRSFRWFIGMAANFAASGFAIYGLAGACTVVTGGATATLCLAGAVGVVGAVFGLIQLGTSSSGGVATNDLELGQMNEVAYVNSFGGNGRRSIGERAQVKDDETKQLLRKALGQDYTFEGHIPVDDKRHAHLIAANDGRPVPVHSFTSSAGIRFHHSVVFDKKKNGFHHRFGFIPAAKTASLRRRQAAGTEAESSNEYFSAGGLDAFDCAATPSSDDHLNAGDASDMTNLIGCNVNNFLNATQLSIQVYDSVSRLYCVHHTEHLY
jgi:hypothetical protein